MFRLVEIFLGTGLLLSLSACGDTCESVKKDLQKIEKDIEKNPESAFDHAEELEELGNKMQELKCFP
jgi:prefoldin subunit 5